MVSYSMVWRSMEREVGGMMGRRGCPGKTRTPLRMWGKPSSPSICSAIFDLRRSLLDVGLRGPFSGRGAIRTGSGIPKTTLGKISEFCLCFVIVILKRNLHFWTAFWHLGRILVASGPPASQRGQPTTAPTAQVSAIGYRGHPSSGDLCEDEKLPAVAVAALLRLSARERLVH